MGIWFKMGGEGYCLFVDWVECTLIYSDFDSFCHEACDEEISMVSNRKVNEAKRGKWEKMKEA